MSDYLPFEGRRKVLFRRPADAALSPLLHCTPCDDEEDERTSSSSGSPSKIRARGGRAAAAEVRVELLSAQAVDLQVRLLAERR